MAGKTSKKMRKKAKTQNGNGTTMRSGQQRSGMGNTASKKKKKKVAGKRGTMGR